MVPIGLRFTQGYAEHYFLEDSSHWTSWKMQCLSTCGPPGVVSAVNPPSARYLAYHHLRNRWMTATTLMKVVPV